REPAVAERADEIARQLKQAGVRAHVDHRDQRPGFKLNDWELKGVPLRVELGPRDLAEGSVVISQRLGNDDDSGKPVKDALPIDGLVAGIQARLERYHQTLL